MSELEQTNAPEQEATPANEAPATTEEKSDNVVPSYRLKEEADKRRAAEKKLAEYEKKEQAAKEAELSFKEKYEKVTKEFEDFKGLTSRKELEGKFIEQALELGFPGKIARLGVPKDLTEDNMTDKMKAFSKEFAEFLPSKEEPKPTNPFTAVQPKSNEPKPRTYAPGHISGQDAMKGLLDDK